MFSSCRLCLSFACESFDYYIHYPPHGRILFRSYLGWVVRWVSISWVLPWVILLQRWGEQKLSLGIPQYVLFQSTTLCQTFEQVSKTLRILPWHDQAFYGIYISFSYLLVDLGMSVLMEDLSIQCCRSLEEWLIWVC